MEFYRRIADKLDENFIGKVFKNKKTQYILVASFFFIGVFMILLTSLKPQKFDLVLGEKAPVNIYSPKDIEDRWATEQLREKAAESVELKYRVDPAVHVEIKKDIEKFFSGIYEIRENEELTVREKIELFEEQNDLYISSEYIKVALEAPTERLKYLESYIYEIIAQNMSMGIKVEDLQKEKNNIKDYILNIKEFDANLREAAIAIVNATIRPNKFFDMEATEKARQEARENVDKIILRKGDMILREGEIVTNHRLEILSELGILTENTKIDLMLYVAIVCVVLVIELILAAYIYVFNKELIEKIKKLVMVCIIFLLILITAKVISGISIYIIPVAACAMLLAILVDPRLAMLVNLCLTVLISIIVKEDFPFIVMALVGGTVGVFSVINTQQRGNIFISGLIVSLVNMISLIGVGFIYSSEVWDVMKFGFHGVLNGVLCSIFAVGSLPLWEYVFGVVTPLKLLELSNPNHPLLKKLLIEAPGTYHHSIIVGNLAEAAVEAVGGNALLARTGAFYHDIGKIKRPYFFKENQLTSENPHDKLNPTLSSLIITGHVKEGLEIAKKYKLPKEIMDFIEQHHGNTLVAYFYHKAKQGENGEEIDEQSFRYGNEKPKTKETAIIMLADSVEAAVRSLSLPTKEKIQNLIEKIIQDKLQDGQLEESNLTLRELELIKKTFTKVIQGIFHERIEYPEMDMKELRGKKNYGTHH